MICTECAATCEALGDEPFVIYICCNCGLVIDPQKATCDEMVSEEERERVWR